MEIEVDVSGGDLLSKNYTVCVANRDSIIKGFKFNEEIVSVLSSKFGQGLYRYKKSKRGKADFKVRLYCVVIYYLIKSFNIKGELSLNICRDFPGKEDDIRKSLKHFLEKELGISLNDRIYFGKLRPDSNAHKYSYLMRHDTKNQMKTYVRIAFEDIEKWLVK